MSSVFFKKNNLNIAFFLALNSLYRGHQGSFLGWSWLVIKPAIQVLIYATIFPYIARVDQHNYSYFLITGILPWTFMSSAILECGNSLISRGEILKRCVIDKTIFPLADVIKHLILFTISFVVMYIMSLAYHTEFNWLIFLLPISLLPCLVFVISASIMTAYITTYIRDLAEIMMIIFNIMFFFTPIIYSIDSLPAQVKFWFKLNPFYWIIEPIRQIMYYNNIPSLKVSIIASSISIVTACTSYILYKYLRKNLIFYL